jgi:hypothetical protein
MSALLLSIAIGFCKDGLAEEPLGPEVAKLRDDQTALVSRLIAVVKAPSTAFERENAIDGLRLLRDARAAPILLEHLTYESELSRSLSRLQKFPAALALAEIGPSVFPAIEGRLLREASDRELLILAFVIYGFDGEGVAETRVARAIRQEKLTELQRENLQKLYALLEDVDFRDPTQWPK